MIFYIALKDIRSFFEREKAVFIWLIVCMTAGAFVLNYSYSTARYDGLLYEHDVGADIPTYTIYAQGVPTDAVDRIFAQMKREKLPTVENYQLFTQENGEKIVGSSFISERSGAFTGCWVLGYAEEIENSGENVCAVNIDIFDSAFELKDTIKYVHGVPFTIKGAYEDGANDVVIFADKFAELFDSFDSMRITFEEKLSGAEVKRFQKIINDNIPNGSVSCPPEAGEAGKEIIRKAQMKYSVIVILMVVCLVSILKYWQSVNIPTYTVYWICGAKKDDLMLVTLCEALLLCAPTYLAGLGLNAFARLFTVRSAGLQFMDILLGAGIFFGAFALTSLINVEKICKHLSVADTRS